jgi:uracil-DNA glycosylase
MVHSSRAFLVEKVDMSSQFEDGPLDAKIALIGEAPALNETVKGYPFAGPSGAVLEQCLHAAGIARAECYITNVFEHPVFKRGEAPTLYDHAGVKLWSPELGFSKDGLRASEGCRRRLAGCSANVLVPMGGPALTLVCGRASPSKWRGSILRSSAETIAFPRKCVPTLHPAVSLHGSYTQRYLISADFRRAREECDSAGINLPVRELITDPTIAQIESAFLACWAAKEFATDIECSRGHVSCFSLSWSPEIAISIPIVDEGYVPRWSAEEEAHIWSMYADILGSEEITKVNQNITFDLAVLLHRNRIVARGPLHDPMIAHSVMNPALEKGLDMLCSLYTREPYYKADNGLDANYVIQDFPSHWRYNAMDAAIALECWWALKCKLEDEGYWETYTNTIAVLSSLIYMMVKGFRVNTQALLRTRERVKGEIIAKVQQIEEAIGRPVITMAPKTAKHKRAVLEAQAININSPKQLASYFYDELKIKPFLRGGNPSTDDKALAQIFRRERNPVAKMMQDYRSLTTLKSRYLEVGLDEDQRLRCSYNPRGTWTGRLSSSETVFKSGMNLQNLPDEFQAFLVSDHAP